MLINIQSVISGTQDRLNFERVLDLSAFDIMYGECPFSEPVIAKGSFENHSGLVKLTTDVQTTFHTRCARCDSQIAVPFECTFHNVIVNEEKDTDELQVDTIVIDGYSVDIDSLIEQNIIINMQIKYLCREDCKGICPGCGSNLNHEQCKCKKDIDPRLAVLKSLIDEK